METSPLLVSRSCIKCSVPLLLGDNWTESSKRNRSYLCRGCNAAKGRAFYAKDPKHVIEVAKARRHRDPDRIKEYWQGWRDADPSKTAKYTFTYKHRKYTDIDWQARKMWAMCRSNAKRRGIEFTISPEWFRERLAVGVCEVTGLAFDLTLPARNERKSRTIAFAPSVDRIEQGGPYAVGNVRMVVFIFNVARSDFTDDALLILARALVSKPPT